MNILGIELQYCSIFYILPTFSVVLGKSLYFRISWLNFELVIKHISSDYKSKCLSFYFPSMTLNQYSNSAYACSFEICAFGYFYRKGLFKHEDKEPYPYDNTKGFVHSSWFNQFRKESDYDFIGNLEKLLDGIKEMTKKEEKYSMKMWIARGVGKDGRLTLHYERPTYTASKGWDKIGASPDSSLFPEVTFENSPQEIELVIKK